uniref:Uncharacterized protein n=1 Tax=Romanomermis culicivorax TaxID=13658 RepID=A0A915IZQ6_ROMCU
MISNILGNIEFPNGCHDTATIAEHLSHFGGYALLQRPREIQLAGYGTLQLIVASLPSHWCTISWTKIDRPSSFVLSISSLASTPSKMKTALYFIKLERFLDLN